MSKPTRSFEILELLTSYDVDFMVVGMTAAVLQGAPAVTFDLDVLYSRRADNVERLLAALADLDAVFRGDPRNLRPERSHLESAGHKLLMTRWGVLDVLGSLGEQDFEDLEGDVVTLKVEDLTCRILSLERLIEVKKLAGRPKDLAVIPLLEATLARSRGRK